MSQGNPPPLTLTFQINDKGEATNAKIINNLKRTNRAMDATVKQSSRVGRALQSMGKRWNSFNRQLFSARSMIQGFIGVIAARALLRHLMSLANNLDNVAKAAASLNMTTEAFSELRFAAELSGISGEKFSSIMERLERRTVRAVAGSKEQVEALQLLNVEAAEFAAIPMDQRLELIAEQLQGVESNTDRARIAMALFGNDGTAVLNILDQGADGLRAMREEAQKFGASIDSEMAAEAEAFNDSLLRIKTTFGALQREALAQFLLPASIEINLMAERMADLRINTRNLNNVVYTTSDLFSGLGDGMSILITQSKLLGNNLEGAFSGTVREAMTGFFIMKGDAIAALIGQTRYLAQEIRQLVPTPEQDRTWAMWVHNIGDNLIEALRLDGTVLDPRDPYYVQDRQFNKLLDGSIAKRRTLFDLVNEEQEIMKGMIPVLHEQNDAEKQRTKETATRLQGQIEEQRSAMGFAQFMRWLRRESMSEEIRDQVDLNKRRQEDRAEAEKALALQEEKRKAAIAIAQAEDERLRTLEGINSELQRSVGKMKGLQRQQLVGATQTALREMPGPMSGAFGSIGGTLAQIESGRRMREEMLAAQKEFQKERANLALAHEAELAADTSELDQDQYAKRLERLQQFHAQEKALAEQHSENLVAIDRQRHQAQMAMTASILGSMGQTLANFRQATENDSAEMAIAQKALAIGQATVNTYLAATAAMASKAVLGPIAAAAAAKAIIALGLANVALIAATPIQRYHTGGFAGQPAMRPNEVPAILERDELVLTPQQQRSIQSDKQQGAVPVAILPDSVIEKYFTSPRGRRMLKTTMGDMGFAT